MKRNKIILTVFILIMIALIFSGCGGNFVAPSNDDQSSVDRASIHGYIKSIEKDLVKNELIPISNASVYLTDSDGKEYIVSTDKNGFYKFNGLSAGVNYIITAYCPQKNDSLVLKDVATKVVEGKEYNAGTADATSTALALILEEFSENEIPPEDVDTDKVLNCEGFSEVKEKVEKVLDEEGDVTESNAINQSVSSFSSSSFDLITGDTTLGAEMIELSPDSYQPKISDLIGYKKKDFRFITLDGTKNSVELNAAALAVEFDLDNGSGDITADLGIFKIILASEGEGERHWIGVEGNILGKAIRIELDFTPGFSAITTSAAYPDYNLIEDTPFVIRLVDYWSDESKILCEGNSSQWIFLPNEEESNEEEIKNVINDFFQALNDENWNKAKSCCIEYSNLYNGVEDMENNIKNIDITYFNLYDIFINQSNAQVFFEMLYQIDGDSSWNSGNLLLQKIDTQWRLFDIEESNKNYIQILAVDPDSGLVDGVDTDFKILVEYNLFSFEKGVIKIGFNNLVNNQGNPDNHWCWEEYDINKGYGTHEFNTTVKPKDWGSEGDFSVDAWIDEIPNVDNFVLDSDTKILTF